MVDREALTKQFRESPEEFLREHLEANRHLMTPEMIAEYEFLLQPTVNDIERSWPKWYGEIFKDDLYGNFVDSLDSVETDDKHHSAAVEWHWNARGALLKGVRPPNGWFAHFPIWSRGHQKTSIARRMILCDAGLGITAGRPGYTLYVGGNSEKVKKTAETIHKMLGSPKIRQFYPGLAEARRMQKRNVIVGWRIDYIHTQSDHIFEFISLEQPRAGANVEDRRISFIVFDDVDSREDSPVIAERNFKMVTREILPMGQADTLLFFAQNLISRYSVMYQIQSQRQRVLTNRQPTIPVPAVRDLVTEPRTVNGIVRDSMVSGKITWRGWDKERAQDEIDRMGLPAFLIECQHEVEESREGLALQNWNDSIHVITESEFAAVMGCDFIPQRWLKYVAHDWARTRSKFHANVAFTLAVSSQNSRVPGAYFAFNPYSFKARCSPEDVALRILEGISRRVQVADGTEMSWKQLLASLLRRTEMESHLMGLTELIEARRNTFAQIIPKYVQPIVQAQNYVAFRGSHEQSKTGALEIYQRVFGLAFQPCNPGMDGGVNAINLAQKVDYTLPHPFKAGVMGYTRFFLIVPEDKAKYNEALSPDDLEDSDLFRYQMKNWRFRDPYLTSAGEMEGELLKLNDDFGNAMMFLFHDNLLTAAPLTHDEAVEAARPTGFSREELSRRTDMTMEQKALTEWFSRALAERALQGPEVEYDEYGQPIPQKNRRWNTVRDDIVEVW